MKKLVFAAVAALVVVSVSNVFASNETRSAGSDSLCCAIAQADTVAPSDTVAPTSQPAPVEAPAE